MWLPVYLWPVEIKLRRYNLRVRFISNIWITIGWSVHVVLLPVLNLISILSFRHIVVIQLGISTFLWVYRLLHLSLLYCILHMHKLKSSGGSEVVIHCILNWKKLCVPTRVCAPVTFIWTTVAFDKVGTNLHTWMLTAVFTKGARMWERCDELFPKLKGISDEELCIYWNQSISPQIMGFYFSDMVKMRRVRFTQQVRS